MLRASDAGYRGVDGRIGYSSQTYVNLATMGPGNPPTFQTYRVLPDRHLQFSIITLDSGTYQIQGSSNMVDWTTLSTISATDSRTTFIAPLPPAAPCYFYRGVLMR